MKATFSDFIFDNLNCSGFESNPDARAVFEILSEDRNIIAMIEASENGKPALSACAVEIEKFLSLKENPTMDLTDTFTKTVIGRMIKSILAPFGYLPSKQNYISKNIQVVFFTSGMCYQKTGEASMHVVKRIEELPAAYSKSVNVELEKKFERELLKNISEVEEKTGYRSHYFLRMIHKYGGVSATRKLIEQSRLTGGMEGFKKLVSKVCLDLTMESSVIKKEYEELFLKDEIRFCKKMMKSAQKDGKKNE